MSRPLNNTIAFLITAAGSGTRMGGGTKKEFRNLGAQTVIEKTLDTFLADPRFGYGLITFIPGTEKDVRDILTNILNKPNSLKKPLFFCPGGSERQQSVRNGLRFLANQAPELLESGIVLIHDGARPWVSPGIISNVIEGCAQHQACAPVVPSVDAMKEINEDGIITGHLPRKQTVGVQTPQGFAFNEILAAHDRAADDGRTYIDDTEIFSRYEGDVYSVPGSSENRKITYAGDLQQ